MQHTRRSREKILQLRSLLFGILLTFVSLSPVLSLAEGPSAHREETSWRILQYDTIAMYIWPVVERLSVDTFPSGPNMQFRVYFAANESGRSLVQMQPQSEGRYNITITFATNGTWSYMVGVYTNTASFYSEYSNLSRANSGTFITFHTSKVEGSSGTGTLVLILNSHGRDSAPSLEFTLPKSTDAVVFVALTLILGYINAFYMSDTYFKNKKEGISRKRWALIAMLLIVSFLIIYQLYVFTTSGSRWSV